jgi:acyl carrier protein
MVELKTLVDIIAGLDVVADMSSFDPEKSFKDNGIDSLDVMSVFLAVEESCNVKFSENESLAINTPNELRNAINAKLA